MPDHPIRTLADVERLETRPDPRRFQHIRDLLKCVLEELHGELPVIVFAGAPFTLATYCIGTGKNIASTRRFAAEQPRVWHELLKCLTAATTHFLATLAADGADVYQLFDSWAGMLTREEYGLWAQPYHEEILRSVATIPRILFVKECPYLDLMAACGANVVSLGCRHDLASARQEYPNTVFQGNVDERLLRTGTPRQVSEATVACVTAGRGEKHIVNLSHGVDRATPVINFEAYVRAAKTGG